MVWQIQFKRFIKIVNPNLSQKYILHPLPFLLSSFYFWVCIFICICFISLYHYFILNLSFFLGLLVSLNLSSSLCYLSLSFSLSLPPSLPLISYVRNVECTWNDYKKSSPYNKVISSRKYFTIDICDRYLIY